MTDPSASASLPGETTRTRPTRPTRPTPLASASLVHRRSIGCKSTVHLTVGSGGCPEKRGSEKSTAAQEQDTRASLSVGYLCRWPPKAVDIIRVLRNDPERTEQLKAIFLMRSDKDAEKLELASALV